MAASLATPCSPAGSLRGVALPTLSGRARE